MQIRAKTTYEGNTYHIHLTRLGGVVLWQAVQDYQDWTGFIPTIPFEELHKDNEEELMKVYLKYLEECSET